MSTGVSAIWDIFSPIPNLARTSIRYFHSILSKAFLAFNNRIALSLASRLSYNIFNTLRILWNAWRPRTKPFWSLEIRKGTDFSSLYVGKQRDLKPRLSDTLHLYVTNHSCLAVVKIVAPCLVWNCVIYHPRSCLPSVNFCLFTFPDTMTAAY